MITEELTIGWKEIPEGSASIVHLDTSSFVGMGKLPSNLGKELDTIAEDIKNSNFENQIPHNEDLVGHLKKEFAIPEEKLSNEFLSYLVWLAGWLIEHDLSFNSLFSSNCDYKKLLDPRNVWINFQEKHEFNPLHRHSGVLSWVVWNKIPYDVEEEQKVFPKMAKIKGSEYNYTSSFNFIYNDSKMGVMSYPILVNKDMENYICIFPSSLNHCVYPFYTSDEYRISFSGNIFLREKC